MYRINNHNIIKCFIFLVIFILKVATKYIDDEIGIKYKNPFFESYNYTEISNNNTIFYDYYSYNIFDKIDYSYLLPIFIFVCFLAGMRFLISTIKKQIKEEIRSDYLLL